MPQPNLKELAEQTKLNDVLKSQQSQYDDCLPCRLMGSAAFTGLGIYTYYSGMKQLREREWEIVKSGTRFGVGARRGAVFVTSAVMVAVGVWRLKN